MKLFIYLIFLYALNMVSRSQHKIKRYCVLMFYTFSFVSILILSKIKSITFSLDRSLHLLIFYFILLLIFDKLSDKIVDKLSDKKK